MLVEATALDDARFVRRGVSAVGGGPDPTIEIHGLPTGNYRIAAHDPRMRFTASSQASVTAGESSEIEVTLARKP